MDRFDLVKESFERKVVPAEVPAGKTSDYFGELVDNKLWPLPKYRELLFIN